MAHCWEEYMWKVHKAVPVDPWASNVELLDVMIAQRPPSLWLPPWLFNRKVQLPHALSRAGSMLSLASEQSCKPKVVANATADDGIGDNEAPIQQFSDSSDTGDASLAPEVDANNNRGNTHHGPSNRTIANSDSVSSTRGLTATHSLRIRTNNTTSGSLLPPHITGASHDVMHPAHLIKSGSVNQVFNKSRTLNGDTSGHMHVVNNKIDRQPPGAQANHIRRYSQSSTKPITKTLSMRASRMPDIQASIKTSTSSLASITGGSSASAQFDVKGSKTVTCNVGGVISQRVDLDALMELVMPRINFDDCFMAPWQPDISLPQLQARPKRGQTLWVVIEILHANFIKIEGDREAQATNKAKVVQGVQGVEVSEQVGVEKEGVWKVTAPKDNPTFPFAVRLQRLKYDANGTLVTTACNNKYLKRNSSLKINEAPLSFKKGNTTTKSINVKI